MDCPVVTYPATRPTLATGDVVTFDGDHLLGRAIRFFAGPGTHTAMVVRSKDAPGVVLLLESLEHGPVFTRMSRRISNYNGRIYVTKATPSREKHAEIAKLAMLIHSAQISYDYPSLFANARRRVALNLKRGYCTETVQYILAQVCVLPAMPTAMVPNDFLTLGWPVYQLAPYTADSEAGA